MVETSRYERQRRSKALQRADPGKVPTGPPTCGTPPVLLNARRAICSACPKEPIARQASNGEALVVTEPLIVRDEIVALLFNVADIASAAIGIETLLREDENGGEEEADEG